MIYVSEKKLAHTLNIYYRTFKAVVLVVYWLACWTNACATWVQFPDVFKITPFLFKEELQYFCNVSIFAKIMKMNCNNSLYFTVSVNLMLKMNKNCMTFRSNRWLSCIDICIEFLFQFSFSLVKHVQLLIVFVPILFLHGTFFF